MYIRKQFAESDTEQCNDTMLTENIRHRGEDTIITGPSPYRRNRLTERHAYNTNSPWKKVPMVSLKLGDTVAVGDETGVSSFDETINIQ